MRCLNSRRLWPAFIAAGIALVLLNAGRDYVGTLRQTHGCGALPIVWSPEPMNTLVGGMLQKLYMR